MRVKAEIDLESLVKPDAVHGDVYIDPDVFAAELERIFYRNWVYIGHASEVPHPGDFKRTTIGLLPVVFCRYDAGGVRVHFNRCRHRGATVCQAVSGNTDVFRCEYHGWTYKLDGTLTHVPYGDGYETLDTAAFGLAGPTRIEDYRGFVFATLSEDCVSLQEYLGRPVMQQLDYFCDLSPDGEILVQAGVSLLAYEGNWKLQMENSIDGYHPNFTHQSFFQSVHRRTGQRVATFDGDSVAQCRALGGAPEDSAFARTKIVDR